MHITRAHNSNLKCLKHLSFHWREAHGWQQAIQVILSFPVCFGAAEVMCHVPIHRICDPFLVISKTVVIERLIISVQKMCWSFSLSRVCHRFCPLTENILSVFCSSLSSITRYTYWHLWCIVGVRNNFLMERVIKHWNRCLSHHPCRCLEDV